MTFALWSLLLLSPPACQADSDPLSAELRRLDDKGYQAAQKASAQVAGTRLVAMVFRWRGKDSLRVFRVSRAAAKTIYMDMAPGAIALDSIHSGGELPDMLADGSRVVAYRVSFAGAGQEKLIVLRYAADKLTRAGEFQFGRFEDLDGAGGLEIVSKTRPLGPWFQIECKSFHSMAQEAFRASIYGWRGGRLESVSSRHPRFFRGIIADLEAQLKAIDARSTDNYGEYLGLTLSLYFAHAEIGEGKEGWKKFRSQFPVRRTDPPPVKRCLREMEDTLRRQLKIPSEW